MRDRRDAGYSLSEVLVVMAIIGVLSLITVPAFMNFQRSAIFKSAMRVVSTDLRGARANSIKTGNDIRVQFQTGGQDVSTKTYQTFESTDGGATWTPLNVRRAFTAAIDDGLGQTFKTLDGPVWFSSAQPDVAPNGIINIVFHPNGTATVDDAAGGTLVLETNWPNIPVNRYAITISAAGQIKTSRAN